MSLYSLKKDPAPRSISPTNPQKKKSIKKGVFYVHKNHGKGYKHGGSGKKLPIKINCAWRKFSTKRPRSITKRQNNNYTREMSILSEGKKIIL